MLRLNSVTFQDDATGRTIEVHTDGSVTSNEKFSYDELLFCKFHTSFLVSGGINKMKEFIREEK